MAIQSFALRAERFIRTDFYGENPFRIEARISGGQIVKGFHQKTGPDNQNHSQRYFTGDEPLRNAIQVLFAER